jgi:hypothetical protein
VIKAIDEHQEHFFFGFGSITKRPMRAYIRLMSHHMMILRGRTMKKMIKTN